MEREKDKKQPCKSNTSKVYSVECRNLRCKTKPATSYYSVRGIAVSMWNNDVVTNHLMSV